MRYVLLGLALGIATAALWPALCGNDDSNAKEVGVEWVNKYHGFAGELSACDNDAVGFYNTMGSKGFTKRYNWGDDNAWEQDFKGPGKPGGGTDPSWADNVDFAYFAGHGNSSGIYFGVNRDDRGLSYSDAEWGDKDLEWIALSSCSVLYHSSSSSVFSRWGWSVFKGLHLILGMHTSMSDTPNQGTYFARFMTGDWGYPSFGSKKCIREAWRQAAWWALPGGQYCAVMGAVKGTINPWNEYLPGYGTTYPDPYPPTGLWWVKYPC